MYKEKLDKAEWQRRNRAELRKRGLCYFCQSPARPGRATCPACYSSRSEQQKVEYSSASRVRERAKSKSAEWYRANPERARETRRIWQRDNREKQRGYEFKSRYGITIEEYDALLAEQKGVCAICDGQQNQARKVLFVDHDHATGKYRGLLCNRCNYRLASVEDAAWLARAQAYLEQYRQAGVLRLTETSRRALADLPAIELQGNPIP
jgi:hypothetical protein